MPYKNRHEFFGNALYRLLHAVCVIHCKMVDQQRDIFRPFTQWRQFDGENAEPIEEVGAKFTIVDHLKEIPMCGADHVQKQSAVVSPLKPSNTARDRAGEGATLMSEQFAFEQTGRNSGAVHLHKGAIRSVAALVNGLSNQFLACSCFPVDQDRGVGPGHDPHHAEYLLESSAVTDNAG